MLALRRAPAALAALLTCIATCLVAPGAATAAELAGRLTDAATGVPVAGARVEVLGTHQTTRTDAQGRYRFEVPNGTYELAIAADVGDQTLRSRLVRQHAPQRRTAKAHVYTDYFLNHGHPALPNAHGLPSFSGGLPAGAPDTIDLGPLLGEANPTHMTIPDPVPTTIRVGFRQDETGGQGCTDSSNPIVDIQQMSLDEYVKGVLPAEIGVFRNIPGSSEVYKAFAIAAKSYALYFMLYYDANNRRTLGRTVNGYTWFHIDNTACNQRYSDNRLSATTSAAQAVAGKILVDKSDANGLSKYEYAASCGEHGTRPEHQNAIVADNPPVSSCVGNWCGHDGCAGHEDNPNVAGSDRCLVRGICQWGAASWGEAGKGYAWMLAHYQPNLQVRDLGPAGPETVVLTGYAYTDPNDIAASGVEGVQISLSDGQTTTTDASGTYRFDQVRVDLGTVDITARKSGYQTATRSKQLDSGVTNWGSIQIVAGSSGDDVGAADAGPIADAGSTDAGSDASSPADVGAQADAAGAGDAGFVDADTPTTRASALGPLVQPSRGVAGGCSSASGASPTASWWLLAGAAALVGWRRRRK